VRWQGRDAEGRPILVIRVAQACQECSSTKAEELGQAVLSQVRFTPGSWSSLSTLLGTITIPARLHCAVVWYIVLKVWVLDLSCRLKVFNSNVVPHLMYYVNAVKLAANFASWSCLAWHLKGLCHLNLGYASVNAALQSDCRLLKQSL